jgi:hypothetical protein
VKRKTADASVDQLVQGPTKEDQHREMEQFYELSGPYFTKKENVMDIEKRKPDDPKYDHTTLYIP